MYILPILILFGLVAFSAPVQIFAQGSTCTIIYGGGEIDCEATVSATAKVTPATESAGTTKGNLPVYEPTSATTTPATGPETLGLISLIPMAAAGFYLKRKKL